MGQDTKKELTEERVREIVKEEVNRALESDARIKLRLLVGEEEAEHILGSLTQAS